MAQKILIRRGGIDYINVGSTIAVTAGELLFASGSIASTSVENVVLIANATGNNSFVPVGRLHTGTLSPTSFDSRLAGLPYYKTDSKALYRIGTSTALDLSGNLEGTTISNLTVTNLLGTSANFSGNITGSNLLLTGNANITGNIVLGGSITIGDANTDNITIQGEFVSSLIPDATNTYDIGSTSKLWRTGYFATGVSSSGWLYAGGALDVDGTSNLNGIVTVNTGLLPDANNGAYIGQPGSNFQLYGINSVISGSFSGSFQGSGAGLTGIPSTAITAPGTSPQVIFNNAGALDSTARMIVTGSGIGVVGTSATYNPTFIANAAFSVTNRDTSQVWVNNSSGSVEPMVYFLDRSRNGVTTFIVQNTSNTGSPGITYMTDTYNGAGPFDAFYTGINNSAHPSLPYTAYFWNQTDRAGAHIRFGTRGNERLRIQDNGEVRAFGILKTDTNLQVTGSTTLVGNVTLAGNSQTVTHSGTGNLTIASTAGNVLIEGTTFSGNNVTIPGNLTVQGTTTQIDSTVVNIGDNIIVLNAAGATSDGGIQVIDRISTTGTGSLLWNATSDYWYAGMSGSTHYRLATYDSQTPTANSIQKVDSNGRLTASLLSDNGTTLTISGNLTANTITANTAIVASGLTGVIDTSSRVIFRDGSNRLGALATTDSNIEMSTVIGYKADGTLVASSLIDGGTF